MELFRGRRNALQSLAPQTAHPGLWLDRYLTHQTWHTEQAPSDYHPETARKARDELLAQLVRLPLADDYRAALHSWRASLEDDPRVVCAEASSLGRVLVGAGQKGPAEFGISLHRTWGTPVLPGSSLKGIAAHAADRSFEDPTWRRRPAAHLPRGDQPNAYDALFGDVREQGAVIFHDAWFLPASGSDQNGLIRDVLTVHHPDYYQQGSDEDKLPSDTDSPVPVPFLSAKGKFFLALELSPGLDLGTHGHWLEAAWVALGEGLQHLGVGAKTNAAYGRLSLPAFADTPAGQRLRAAMEHAKAQEEARALRELPTPEARVESLAQTHDLAGLRRWLASGGAELSSLPFDQEHVRAAAAMFFQRRAARGVEAELPEAARPWWREGIGQRDSSATTAGGFGPNHRETTTFPKKLDPDRFARMIAQGDYDEPTVRAALQYLRDRGAKPGHLRHILQRYPLGSDEA